MNSDSADTYLTEQEVAERYRVGVRTLQTWRHTGNGGPAYVRVGLRRIAYRLSDCELWARSRTYPHLAAELASQAAA